MEQKTALFNALLAHVPFDGWSQAALRRAAEEVGVSHGLAEDWFPDAMTMIDHYHDLANAAMSVPAGLGIRDGIKAAILSRLDYVKNDREAVRRALSVAALPNNLYGSMKRDYRTADAMWQLVGSNDQGFDWATKRTSLLAVYGATLFYWLREEDEAKVEAFLDRQLDRLLAVMGPIGRFKSRIFGAT